MTHRLSLALLLPALLLLAACGGSASGGEGTSASTDPFAQLRYVLAKFPYAPFYRRCLLEEVERKLSAAELEELAELPKLQARRAALRFALGATPRCEGSGRDPIIPNPSHVQVNLLRIGYARTLEALGRREGLDAKQARCLGSTIAGFSDREIVALGNASEKQREAKLVEVVEGCAR